MGTSLFIAKIFGICYLVMGIGFVINRDFYRKVMEDFFKNAALVFYGGAMSLIIGIVIVLLHNRWVANWTVIITIIGWGGLIKGVWILVFPNSVAGFMKTYVDNKALLRVHSVLIIIFGVALTYLGFFAG